MKTLVTLRHQRQAVIPMRETYLTHVFQRNTHSNHGIGFLGMNGMIIITEELRKSDCECV
jgi:hypothetical protein